MIHVLINPSLAERCLRLPPCSLSIANLRPFPSPCLGLAQCYSLSVVTSERAADAFRQCPFGGRTDVLHKRYTCNCRRRSCRSSSCSHHRDPCLGFLVLNGIWT